MRKQKMISFLVVMFFAGSTVFATAPAYAAEATNTNGGIFNDFVNFFSSKFNVDKTQVQSAMKEFKETKMQKREEHMENHMINRLDALVKNGKITEAQKQAILTKLSELQSKYNKESIKDLTPEERKKKMDEQKAEIEAFAKSQNIDVKYVMPGFGMGMKMRKFDKWGDNFAKPSITPTP